MSTRSTRGIATRAVRGGVRPDPITGALLTPIHQSTTYAQHAVGEHRGFTYSRASNPTVEALERALGELEEAPPAVCFSTGMGAIAALFIALLRAGDHAVVSEVVYGGTTRLLRRVLGGLGVRATFVDATPTDRIGAAIEERTRLVFVETPANPTLALCDIEAAARIARRAGVPLAVDNTFLTPVLQRPLDLGADVCITSTTKFVEGHNATLGGAITSRDEGLLERLRLVRKTLGSIQSPFEAWLTLRGIKTLPVRMERHGRSAQAVAEWLERHPRVRSVRYPGLASFPQLELAQRQQRGAGGVLAFELRGGADEAVAVMNAARLCTLAENLGAAETLITHPVTMTHGDVPDEQRARCGITAGLIRLSVGLEDPEDIIADLERAFAAASTSAAAPGANGFTADSTAKTADSPERGQKGGTPCRSVR